MQIFQLSGERKKNNKKLFLFIDWLSGFVLYMFTSQYHSLKLTLRDLLLLWVQRESVLPEQQHFIMVSAGQTSVARWAGKYFFITVLSNEMDRVLVSWIFKFHFISFCGGFFFLGNGLTTASRSEGPGHWRIATTTRHWGRSRLLQMVDRDAGNRFWRSLLLVLKWRMKTSAWFN